MYGHNFVAKAHRVTILQPMGWYKGTRAFKSRFCGMLVQAVDQKQIIFVGPFNSHAQTFGQLRGAARMIQMTMSEQNFFNRDALICDGFLYAFNVAARVGYRALHILFTLHDRAVLGIGRDWNYNSLHETGCPAYGMMGLLKLGRYCSATVSRSCP